MWYWGCLSSPSISSGEVTFCQTELRWIHKLLSTSQPISSLESIEQCCLYSPTAQVLCLQGNLHLLLHSQGNFGVLRSKSGGLVSDVLLTDPVDGTHSCYFHAVLCWPGRLDYQSVGKLSAGKESPPVMGTGQCVLLCNASWLGWRVERGTWQARMAGTHGRHAWPAVRLPWVLCCRDVLHSPVLTCCYWDLHKGRWSPEAASSIVLHPHVSWPVSAVLGREAQPQAGCSAPLSEELHTNAWGWAEHAVSTVIARRQLQQQAALAHGDVESYG